MLAFKEFVQALSEAPLTKNAAAALSRLRAKQAQTQQQRQLITKAQLDALERHLDALFRDVGIDIEFTKHFFERLHDARNKKDITIDELNDIFRKVHDRYGLSLKNKSDDWQAVMKSLTTKINIPFVLKINKRGHIELVSKTVMRKANFKTPNPELKVR